MIKLGFTIILLFLMPYVLLAQITEMEPINITAELLDKEAKSSVVNERNLSNQLFQGGGFLSTIGGGVEVTWRPGPAPWYSNFFFSGMMNPGKRVPEANRILTAGFNIGYERKFYSTEPKYPHVGSRVVNAGVDGTQFYARFGPGIGISGIGKINNNSFEYHPVIHSAVIAGALMSISENASIYVELGGRTAWYPTLNEMGFLIGPQLNIGIQISKGPNLRFIDF